MAQTIQDFFRVAQQRGFSRDFMMRVTSIGEDTFNEDDFVYITTKQLPDRQISNQATPFMGLNFNVPGTVTYPGSDAWNVVFRNDLKGIVRAKLEDWQINKVFNDQTSTGDLSVRGTDKLIQLDLIDDKQNILNTYKLYGVYIKNIGTVDHDLTGDGKLTTFTAVLAYHYWRHE
jgi:hypothetical protein